MPREFYPDTRTAYAHGDPELCWAEITMFDGPGVCTRSKGHKVDVMKPQPNANSGEFHQEAFEGWVWDSEGTIG